MIGILDKSFMNEPYVLGALRRMLAIYDRTGILSESSDVYKGLVGVGTAAKAEYLKNYRENYFAVFTALPDEEKPFRIEASLDSLVVFWNDSHQRYFSANDGIGMDGVAWSLIKTYHQETVYFICFLYRCSLLFPTDELYDIEGKFKGLQLKDVHRRIFLPEPPSCARVRPSPSSWTRSLPTMAACTSSSRPPRASPTV